MSIKNLTKEELEAMSYKDITYLMIEENGPAPTNKLFKGIIDLLDLPDNMYETKIGDYYTSLSTDKRFILLDNGNWDLKIKHPKKSINVGGDLDDLEEVELEEDGEDGESFDDYGDDSIEDEVDEEELEDDTEEYKDLIIVDEDELDIE